MALATQARRRVLSSADELAGHLRECLKFGENSPENVTGRFHELACDYLSTVSDPQFFLNKGNIETLWEKFGLHAFQDTVNSFSDRNQESEEPFFSVPRAPTSSLSVSGPLSPQAPPAKRSRQSTASSVAPGSLRDSGMASQPSMVPRLELSQAGSSISAGGGRISRSISRGSTSSRGSLRPIPSSSRADPGQEDRKRKRTSGK